MGLLTRQSVRIDGDVDSDTTEGEALSEDIANALEMGLEAVANSIRDRFPDARLTITVSEQ